jgi:hypothetical protein
VLRPCSVWTRGEGAVGASIEDNPLGVELCVCRRLCDSPVDPGRLANETLLVGIRPDELPEHVPTESVFAKALA